MCWKEYAKPQVVDCTDSVNKGESSNEQDLVVHKWMNLPICGNLYQIRKKIWGLSFRNLKTYLFKKRISPLCIILERARCDCTLALILAHMSHSMEVYMCVCVEESDLVGLHPAGGLLYDIKLDEGESSALTWTPPSAVVTEQWQQQHNNNAVRG